MIFGRKKMDHPPSPVLVSKLSRSLQARKRKQKSYVVKNKSSNHLDNVIEKIVDNNDIITNTVKEIENCLQIVKSTESQFTINDAEILNNNLDSRINTLQEIQGIIEKENDYLDISLAVQNNVLNYVQSLKSRKEEEKLQKNSIVSLSNIASTSRENENVSREVNQYLNSKLANSNTLSKKLSEENSLAIENDIMLDDFTSDQDLLDDENDSKISNLVNTIISGTKVYSSTPIHEKYQAPSHNYRSKLNTSYKPKSINISENSLKSASKLFEDMLESPRIEARSTQFTKNIYKKSLNFTESEMNEDCFNSDITDTQMNQIVDEAIVVTKSEKLEDECFNGFESTSVNHSQEIKENFEDNLHQWSQSFLDLSENLQSDFKGFHQVNTCHKILRNINLEIERLKNTLPVVQNKLKRFQQDENTSNKYVKKYRYDSCNDRDNAISRDVSNQTIDFNDVLDTEFRSASNKHIEIKNSDLSKAQHLFNHLDDYKILLNDNKLVKKPSKIPLKSDSNIGRKFEEIYKNSKISQHSEPSFTVSPSELFSNQKLQETKLTRAERHELTLQNLAEMEKSFKVAENVFAFNTDSNKNKKNDTSKAFFEFHESFNTTVKDKDDSLYKRMDEETKAFSMKTDTLDFQTASSKKVKVNDDSLRKVKNLFQDIVESNSDIELSLKMKSLSNEELCFRTASNKKCKINEDVLRNVDILFKDISEFSTDNIEPNFNKHSIVQEEVSELSHKDSILNYDSLQNFNKQMDKNPKIDTLKEINSIASNSSSNDSLNFEVPVKTNKSLPAVHMLKENNLENLNNKTLQVNQNCHFQTASCKTIKTNEKSLRSAQNLFKDIENSDTITVCNKFTSFDNSHIISSETFDKENNLKKSTACSNFEFSIPPNKALETRNEKAFEKIKTFLNVIDNRINLCEDSQDNSEKYKKKASCDSKNINDTITINSCKIPSDILSDENNFKRPVDCSNIGFSTASNKIIEVVEQNALEKAKTIFKDIDENINIYDNAIHTLEKYPKQSTVSKVNNDSMSKARNLFQDIFDEYSIECSENKESELILNTNLGKLYVDGQNMKQDTDLQRKQSSGSESFKVNNNSLNKARNLFKDIFNEYSNIDTEKKESELILNTNLGESFVGDKNMKQNINICKDISETNEIYYELENAVKCFETMDETMQKTPTSDEIQNNNELLNLELMTNKNLERKSEKDDKLLDIQVENLATMPTKFYIEDNNSKSEYSDVDETLIEDTDDFTDAGSIGSKSDLDVIVHKDKTKTKQHGLNVEEIKSDLNDGKHLPGLYELNIAELMSLNQKYLNRPCISLRQRSDGDLKKWSLEIEKQILDFNSLVSLLKQKKSYIENLMDSNSKNQTINFVPGKLYKEKQKHRNLKISLTSAVKNCLPVCSNELPSLSMRRFSINLWDITPENACDLHFFLPSPPNPFIIVLTDNVKLVPSSSYFAGLTEFKIAFETMPGVNKHKIIDGWFNNHFRWIVWKLASMDRQFPNHFHGFFLTPDNLMQQLKYRYDRDIYANERSAIRKITERDDLPSRRMVLCVSNIIEISNDSYEMELSDGWYSLKASIDLCLMNQIRLNKVQVGTKLITYGAELLNVPEPCHPLQVQQSARLKIHGNSTRRVKWDTKLGFQKIPGPFRTSVQSIHPFGGYVGRVLGFIARTFPLKYVEKMGNEQWVCRCKRAEARRDRVFQMEQEKFIEKVHQEVFESLQNQWHTESLSIIKENKNSSDIQKLTCPKKILALLEFNTDSSSISELLSKSQLQLAMDYRSKLNSQRQADVSLKVQTILKNRGFEKRTVSSVLQIIIVDAFKPNLNNHYIIEIWNPDSFILDTLTENSTVYFLNITSTNVRGDNILRATKQTRYLKVVQQNISNYQFCLRNYTPIRHMQLIEYNPSVKYCDTVGVIVKICSEDTLIKYVWLADAHYRLLRIIYKIDSNNCLAFEGFHVGDIVAVFNLKLSKCILGQAQALIDFVTYVTKSPSNSSELTTAIVNLHKELPLSFNDFICDCDDKIAQWNNEILL